MQNIIFRFVIGGLLVAVLSEISRKSPKLGGFLSVLPNLSIIVMIFTVVDKGVVSAQIQAFSAIVGSIVTMGIYFSLWKILDNCILMSDVVCNGAKQSVVVEPYDVFDDCIEEDMEYTCTETKKARMIIRPAFNFRQHIKTIYMYTFNKKYIDDTLYNLICWITEERGPPLMESGSCRNLLIV